MDRSTKRARTLGSEKLAAKRPASGQLATPICSCCPKRLHDERQDEGDDVHQKRDLPPGPTTSAVGIIVVRCMNQPGGANESNCGKNVQHCPHWAIQRDKTSGGKGKQLVSDERATQGREYAPSRSSRGHDEGASYDRDPGVRSLWTRWSHLGVNSVRRSSRCKRRAHVADHVGTVEDAARS